MSTSPGTVIFFSRCGRLRADRLRTGVFFTVGAAGVAGPENGVPIG